MVMEYGLEWYRIGGVGLVSYGVDGIKAYLHSIEYEARISRGRRR
jgi:hypothetical protein